MSTSSSSVQVNRGVDVYVAVKVNEGDKVDVKVNVHSTQWPVRRRMDDANNLAQRSQQVNSAMIVACSFRAGLSFFGVINDGV